MSSPERKAADRIADLAEDLGSSGDPLDKVAAACLFAIAGALVAGSPWTMRTFDFLQSEAKSLVESQDDTPQEASDVN